MTRRCVPRPPPPPSTQVAAPEQLTVLRARLRDQLLPEFKQHVVADLEPQVTRLARPRDRVVAAGKGLRGRAGANDQLSTRSSLSATSASPRPPAASRLSVAQLAKYEAAKRTAKETSKQRDDELRAALLNGRYADLVGEKLEVSRDGKKRTVKVAAHKEGGSFQLEDVRGAGNEVLDLRAAKWKRKDETPPNPGAPRAKGLAGGGGRALTSGRTVGLREEACDPSWWQYRHKSSRRAHRV